MRLKRAKNSIIIIAIILMSFACHTIQNATAVPNEHEATLKALEDLHARYRDSKLTPEQFKLERDRLASSEADAFALGQQLVFFVKDGRQSSKLLLADLLLHSLPQHMQRQIIRGILSQYSKPQLAVPCNVLLEETSLALLEQALPSRAENEEKNVEFPLGAIAHFIKEIPDAAFDALAKSMLPERKRARLWEAQRELMQYSWRRYNFSKQYADDKAGNNVVQSLSELVGSDNVLCKLYAVRFLTANEHLRTPDLVKTLEADTNEYVKAAVAAWDKKDAP